MNNKEQAKAKVKVGLDSGKTKHSAVYLLKYLMSKGS